eukprot:g11612.t1
MKRVGVHVLIICLLLISVVSGKDLTCKPGEGVPTGVYGFTSGPPSQCSGIDSITTEEDCKAAAEYNRKNNIDDNDGYAGRVSYSYRPYGCYYYKMINWHKYWFNGYHNPTKGCDSERKCICKAKLCSKCPKNTYSEGGINPTCTSCPNDRPFTKLLSKQDSIDACTSDLLCKPGYGMVPIVILNATQCSGNSLMATAEECQAAAEYNSRNNIDSNAGYGGLTGQSEHPHGCISVDNIYKYNFNTHNPKTCSDRYKCICKKKTQICTKCPTNSYNSEGGINPLCKSCTRPQLTNTERTRCINPADLLETVQQDIDKQKEETNDLSIKNSRLWAKETTRLQYDKITHNRKNKDMNDERTSCEKQRDKGTTIFPAIEISNEIEKIEDTTCIDTNRDELLKSFCSFTSDLDNLFQIQNIDKEAKSFWPNICCKERRDKTLETCEDSTGKIKRENIIPFALSQGGDYSRHNLYVEVTDTIKKNGYLHRGMIKLLDSLQSIRTGKRQNAKHLIDLFFNDVSLCGPRIVDAPGAKDKKKLCELFIPYQHSMTQFYNLIESLYKQPMPIQTSSSFLETMEKSLRKRSAVKRIGKNNMQQVMQAKPAKTPKAEQQCKHFESGSTWTSENLATMKQTYCTGYNHLDLSSTEIKNIAIHYLKNDIAYDDKKMFSLKQSLRYEIDDASCPAAPLFTPKDISIQQVAMDTLGKKKEWVAVVNLNTKDDNGYLQSELPRCESEKHYLIGAKVNVKAYVDNENCCLGEVNYQKCIDGCEHKLKKLKDKRHKHYSKDVLLTGTQYRVENSHVRRRRRLLQYGRGGC